jgi:hypothetical protein
MTIYLYVKTHNKTGLKYLGKTTLSDPHKYPGSGLYWKRHLKTYGRDYSTEILKECQDTATAEYWGSYYSNLWNIVESKEWANLIPENGRGGGGLKGRPGRQWNDADKESMSKKLKGRGKGIPKPPRTEEHKQNMSKAKTGVKQGPCPDYKKEKIGLANRMPLETFIKRSNEIHQFKYDYSLVEYKNAHTKIQIICPIHGMWHQFPMAHLDGKGCLPCSINNRRKTPL